jgi:4-hydroxy-2-oxoheptanedioate aldolase
MRKIGSKQGNVVRLAVFSLTAAMLASTVPAAWAQDVSDDAAETDADSPPTTDDDAAVDDTADAEAADPGAERTRFINPVIERLANGEPFIGVSTGNMSLEHAKALTRSGIDYVYVDFEHNPMDLTALYHFTLGTIDKAAIVERGDLRHDLAVFARFPPYGREQVEWISKQALDIGLMGIIFNSVDNAEQAELAVRSMRYPPRRDAEHPEPAGLRGWSPGLATWLWGVSSSEYAEIADVWPLNPDGELLAIMMIETADGVENVEEIAAVPGVGALFVGPADMARSFGVSGDSPEIEEALDRILAACLEHDVACGKSFAPDEIAGRIEDGWMMLNLAGAPGGLNPTNALALEAAEEAIGTR